MRTTLEDLYYGSTTPYEQRMISGSEMKKAVGDFLTDIFGEELRPREESAKAARAPSV